MWYLKVRWRHGFRDEPILIYSEVGDDGYETRKVQQFRDETLEWADERRETDRTGVSEVPVGSLEEIAAQEEFSPEVINAEEFEDMWRRARNALE